MEALIISLENAMGTRAASRFSVPIDRDAQKPPLPAMYNQLNRI